MRYSIICSSRPEEALDVISDRFIRQLIVDETEISIGTAFSTFLPLGEAIASREVFVIVSGSDGRADGQPSGNAFGAS